MKLKTQCDWSLRLFVCLKIHYKFILFLIGPYAEAKEATIISRKEFD